MQMVKVKCRTTVQLNKRNKMKLFLIIALLIISLTYCSNPVNNNENLFDDRILGKWGNILPSYSQTYPTPPYYFMGYSFTENEMNLLGIEHNTGKIREFENSNYNNFTFLSNNQFEVDVVYHPVIVRKRYSYSFSNDSLILDDGSEIIKYNKIDSDSSYFGQQKIEFKFTYGKTTYKNDPISYHLSAYLSKINENHVLIKGHAEGISLTLEIDNFIGKGLYRAPNFGVKLWEISGDVISGFESDSVYIGEIRITRYNEGENICYGYFSFTEYTYYTHNSPFYADVRYGQFSLPIYK